MNKKLLAVALATAFAAPAMAEGVQIYGAFDVGVLVRGGGNGVTGTSTQVASGMNGLNGIGFKMSEDLGNGLTISGDAFFQFALDGHNDNAFDGTRTVPTSAPGGFSSAYSYLALSGDFGTLLAGRTGGARAAFIKQYDPFGGYGVGGALGAQGGGEDYADNVIAYVSPEVLPGLKLLGAYTSNLLGQDSLSSTKAHVGSSPLYAVAGLYNAGPVSATIAYESLSVEGSGHGQQAVWTGGASYDAGVVKVMGLYQYIELATHGWQVGAAAPMGATTLKIGYVSAVNGGDNCKKAAVGVNYDLSKRTRVYADAAHLMSEAGCNGGLNTSGSDHGGAGVGGMDNSIGFGRTGANVGVRHTF